MATLNPNPKSMSDAQLDAAIAKNLAYLSSQQGLVETSKNEAQQALASKLYGLSAIANPAGQYSNLAQVQWATTTAAQATPTGTIINTTIKQYNPYAGGDVQLIYNAYTGGHVESEEEKQHNKLMKRVDKVFNKLHRQVSKDLVNA